jgi:ribosomal protein S18 acetylase RimI-like enzyme
VPAIGVTLRPYQPPDFETLLAMDQACFPKPIAYRRRELKRYLQLESSHCIVAEYGTAVLRKKVAGFILTERNGALAHIITLDVLEAYRRMSVGSSLLEAAEREADSHGALCMYLETATTNKAAIALWKKHGYRETGTIENYYGRGQHAYEMLKPFARKSKVKGV